MKCKKLEKMSFELVFGHFSARRLNCSVFWIKSAFFYWSCEFCDLAALRAYTRSPAHVPAHYARDPPRRAKPLRAPAIGCGGHMYHQASTAKRSRRQAQASAASMSKPEGRSEHTQILAEHRSHEVATSAGLTKSAAQPRRGKQALINPSMTTIYPRRGRFLSIIRK